MSKILLLSTPLNEQQSGIALVNEPQLIQRVSDKNGKVQKIKGFQDQFWKSVGGIIWNPIVFKVSRNGIQGFSIKLPEATQRETSFVDGFNFPSTWTIEQKEEYIQNQVRRILNYTSINTLWLKGDQNWDSYWKR